MTRVIRRLLLVLAALLGLVVAAGAGFAVAVARYNAPGPLAVTGPIIVPHGKPEVVAHALVEAGVIAEAWPFRVAAFVTSTRGGLRAGEFVFPEHASLFATLAILRNGRAVQHKLTIPEGLTAAQIAEILDHAPALDGETPVPAEGGFMPETYAYAYGTTREALAGRAATAMDHAVAQVWEARDPSIPLTSPQQLLILASIVERETARPEERAHVAAVFLNRLKRGMKLQSDPTTAYAVSGGLSTNDRGLTRANLEMANPYNTYFAQGLPPGPIGSPGFAALQAVAWPLLTGDLYFVADGSGGHAFASTLDGHMQNVAHWRAVSGHP